jgi:hypothetical protein
MSKLCYNNMRGAIILTAENDSAERSSNRLFKIEKDYNINRRYATKHA